MTPVALALAAVLALCFAGLLRTLWRLSAPDPVHVVAIRQFTRLPRAGSPESIEILMRISELLRTEHGRVVVDFDGTLGYSSAFLREVFGALGFRFELALLRERLELRSEDHSLVTEAWGYIAEASSPRPVA